MAAALGLAAPALHGLCHGASNLQVADDCTRVSACPWCVPTLRGDFLAWGTGLEFADGGMRMREMCSLFALNCGRPRATAAESVRH